MFSALQTQWAVGGMGGVVGLRYESLPPVLDLLGIGRRKRQALFADLQVMELEALKVLNDR